MHISSPQRQHIFSHLTKIHQAPAHPFWWRPRMWSMHFRQVCYVIPHFEPQAYNSKKKKRKNSKSQAPVDITYFLLWWVNLMIREAFPKNFLLFHPQRQMLLGWSHHYLELLPHQAAKKIDKNWRLTKFHFIRDHKRKGCTLCTLNCQSS